MAARSEAGALVTPCSAGEGKPLRPLLRLFLLGGIETSVELGHQVERHDSVAAVGL